MGHMLYFEFSWAILSTIGVANLLYGLTIIAITRVTPVSLVPIIVSTAAAIANGLCYYAFYANYPRVNTAAASCIADLMWLVQEAGITFYSYIILTRLLPQRELVYLKTIFWSLLMAVAAARMIILVNRIRAILDPSLDLQRLINGMHIGYFVGLALIECTSATFLIRTFLSAKKISLHVSHRAALFRHLMRSTEIRQAILALLGITRAVTYFFQPTLQASTNLASQIDRFIYTLECLFPVMLYIDILASRITALSHSTQHSLPPISARQAPDPDRRIATAGSNVSILENDASQELGQRRVTKYSSFDSVAGSVVSPVNPKARLPFDASEGIVRTVEFSVNRTRELD
ncbi:hypothetical protein NLU13_2607 [Sarocladium strictum]|uniref:Uncharacterized protein n=1 Tax=Sarocladium strictum TaxID=5046 RepID=A0AA39GKU2_SARSR|nr:hypothetical protein NLU13_2607 [Sarocladium strictum]